MHNNITIPIINNIMTTYCLFPRCKEKVDEDIKIAITD